MPENLPRPRRRGNFWIRLAFIVAALGVFAFLFMRSVRETRSVPYDIATADLRGWRVEVEATAGPGEPLVVLRPENDAVERLFAQVFKRAMESLSTPPRAAISLVMRGEETASAALPEALATLARAQGLETEALRPRCIATRRVSEPGQTRQMYFAAFESPAFDRFRRAVAALASEHAAAFNAAALSPAIVIASTDQNFSRWQPLALDPSECVAPLVASPARPSGGN